MGCLSDIVAVDSIKKGRIFINTNEGKQSRQKGWHIHSMEINVALILFFLVSSYLFIQPSF